MVNALSVLLNLIVGSSFKGDGRIVLPLKDPTGTDVLNNLKSVNTTIGNPVFRSIASGSNPFRPRILPKSISPDFSVMEALGLN
jgi:hypothetical protein